LRCAKVLQPVERALDAPAQLVETLVEAGRLFPVAAIWNDRLGSALAQVFAQLGAMVGPVTDHPFRWLHSANEALCDRAIVCFTVVNRMSDKAPFNICECMDLRVAARAANSLTPYPPAAELCAFT
jgi:hypothetical protein